MAGISLPGPAAAADLNSTLPAYQGAASQIFIGTPTTEDDPPADYATAVGTYTNVHVYGTAIGAGAQALSQGSVAAGFGSTAGTTGYVAGQDCVAIGASAAAAGGVRNTAVGGNTIAGDAAGQALCVAVGGAAQALKSGAVAIGGNSVASLTNNTAIGQAAQSTHARSTALGSGAVTTKADQIMLGTTSGEVCIPSGLSLPTEQGPPLAPATGARIYTSDNGSGKTRLMVLFPTGAAIQIAIEP